MSSQEKDPKNVQQEFVEKELKLAAIKLKNRFKSRPAIIQSVGAMQANIARMYNNPLYEEFTQIFENLGNDNKTLEEAIDDCYRLGRSSLNPNFFGFDNLTNVVVNFDKHNYAVHLRELLFGEYAVKPRDRNERKNLIDGLKKVVDKDFAPKNHKQTNNPTRFLVKIKELKETKKFGLEDEFKFLNDREFILESQKKDFIRLHAKSDIIVEIDGYAGVAESIDDLYEELGKEKKDPVNIKYFMDNILESSANLLRNYALKVEKLESETKNTDIEDALEFLKERIYYFWRFLEEFGCNIKYVTQDTNITAKRILTEYQLERIRELIDSGGFKSIEDIPKLFFRIYTLDHITLHNELPQQKLFALKKRRYLDELYDMIKDSYKKLKKIKHITDSQKETLQDLYDFFYNFIKWRSGEGFFKISTDDRLKYLSEIDEDKLIDTTILSAITESKILFHDEAKEILKSSRELKNALIRAGKYNPYSDELQLLIFDNEELNKGGQGTIQSAFDPSTSSIVALKLPLKGKEETSIRKLVEEAKILKKQIHPNIIFCKGTYEGKYPIMENFPGENLGFYFAKCLQKECESGLNALIEFEKNLMIEEVQNRENEGIKGKELVRLKKEALAKTKQLKRDDIKNKYKITFGIGKEIISQICEPTILLQKNNVCHRDFKPENFMMIMGEQPILKICDFGAAIYGSSNDSPVYSIAYMAPENILGISKRFDYLYKEILLNIPGLHDDVLKVLVATFGQKPGLQMLDKAREYFIAIDTDEHIEFHPGLTDMFSATEIMIEMFAHFNRNKVAYIDLKNQIYSNNMINDDPRRESVKKNVYELVLLYNIHKQSFSKDNIYIDLEKLNPMLARTENLGKEGTRHLNELINKARHYYAVKDNQERISPANFLREYKELDHRYLGFKQEIEIPVDFDHVCRHNPYQIKDYNYMAAMWYLNESFGVDSQDPTDGENDPDDSDSRSNSAQSFVTPTVEHQTINTVEPTVYDFDADSTKTHMGVLPYEIIEDEDLQAEKNKINYDIPIPQNVFEQIIKNHFDQQFVRNQQESFADFRKRMYIAFENVSKQTRPNEKGLREYKLEWDTTNKQYVVCGDIINQD